MIENKYATLLQNKVEQAWALASLLRASISSSMRYLSFNSNQVSCCTNVKLKQLDSSLQIALFHWKHWNTSIEQWSKHTNLLKKSLAVQCSSEKWCGPNVKNRVKKLWNPILWARICSGDRSMAQILITTIQVNVLPHPSSIATKKPQLLLLKLYSHQPITKVNSRPQISISQLFSGCFWVDIINFFM